MSIENCRIQRNIQTYRKNCTVCEAFPHTFSGEKGTNFEGNFIRDRDDYLADSLIRKV